MVETLTTFIVVIGLITLALIGLAIFLLYRGWGSSGPCPNCGGSGLTIVRGAAGNMQSRCPFCNG